MSGHLATTAGGTTVVQVFVMNGTYDSGSHTTAHF